MGLATRIRAARKHAGLSQEQLAGLLEVSRAAIANWEDDARSRPSTGHVIKLAETIDVSLEWLVLDRGDMLQHIRQSQSTFLPIRETTRTAEEYRLLKAYRGKCEEVRRWILEMIESHPDRGAV